MALTIHQATCIRRHSIARDIVELTVTKPEGFSFKPGQFILFDVPLAGHPDDVQTRAFSIASAPHERELLFVFKLKEGGRASAWVQTLQQGQAITFKGPFGMFTLRDDPADVVMLCTSTGVAPFHSMLADALARHDQRRFDLVFGVRNEEDLFWLEALRSLAAQMSSFFVHVVLSQPSPEWAGHKGRIQTVVQSLVPDLLTRKIYVCGNPAMTDEVKKLCLEQWGIEKQNLHVEGYI